MPGLRPTFLALSLAAAPLGAVEPDLDGFRTVVVPFMERYCVECHGAEKTKAGFRADKLEPAADSVMADHWVAVADQLGLGDMPPDDHDLLPKPAETELVMDWIHTELRRAEEALSQTHREVVLRRLTPLEYDLTLRDLLGIDLEQFRPSHFLLEEIETEGFSTNGANRVLSPADLEAYVDAAARVVEHAIVPGPQPKLFDESFPATREFLQGNLPPPEDGAEVWFEHSFHRAALPRNRFQAHADGRYRVTVRARAVPPAMKVPGPKRWPAELSIARQRPSEPKNPEERVFAVTESSEDFTADYFLKEGDHFQLEFFNGWELSKEHLDEWREKGWHPHLIIENVRVSGPLHESWPPPTHQAIFGPREPADTVAAGEEILRRFATRAFRRPTPDGFLKPFFQLFRDARQDGADFHSALKPALQAILASPAFLYLLEPPDELDDFALASRLSYFLWSSMPDDELLRLAAEGKLSDPATLVAQADRLLADSRADAFFERFASEWLETDRVAEMPPDKRLYPEYDADLREAMKAETRLFLRELLVSDLPLARLVDADFTFVNERLARHYGIDGVEGPEMRRVPLRPEHRRGGLLTQASILNVTSNGTTSSPVVRGVFVLDRILGMHPPQAPPDVPAIEPDIRGASTIREQLAKHREIPSCAGCHAKIDPVGFALESYDVLGGWRDRYRTVAAGKGKRKGGYQDGPEVQTADRHPTLGSFEDIEGLKRRLLQPAVLTHVEKNFAERLLAFGLGRSLQFADQPELEATLTAHRRSGTGARGLLHHLITSKLFLQP